MLRLATLVLACFLTFAVLLPADAHAQVTAPDDQNDFPLAKLELGGGWSPFGVGNGANVRGAVAIFPTRLGVIARLSAHKSAKGTDARLISLAPPEGRIVDRAVMLAGLIDANLDADITVALGVGQLWGDKLNADHSQLVPFEQKLGVAAEIGAYMQTPHSGFGTLVMATVTGNAYVVGLAVTVFIGI